MSLISKNTHCGSCGTSMTRRTRQMLYAGQPSTWASYECDSDNCDRIYVTCLQIGENKDQPRTLVGESFALSKDFFKKIDFFEGAGD